MEPPPYPPNYPPASRQAQAFGVPILQLPQDTPNPTSLPPGVYIFANAHSWVLFHKNPPFAEALRRAQGVFADGVGTIIACQLHSRTKPSRMPGPNFTQKTLQLYAEQPMTFVGGSPRGFQKIQEKYSLQQAHQIIPPQRDQISLEDTLKDIERIPENSPQIFWVCLGSPKQEIWAHHASKLLPTSHFFCVGAAFAFLSGEKKRAPEILQKMGLEWAHRLYQEPQRLSQRYLLGNPLLLFYTIAHQIKKIPQKRK